MLVAEGLRGARDDSSCGTVRTHKDLCERSMTMKRSLIVILLAALGLAANAALAEPTVFSFVGNDEPMNTQVPPAPQEGIYNWNP